MNPRNAFAVPEHSALLSAALLLFRLVAGIAFMLHGWGKIQQPFTWMGPDSFAPAPFQALAALAEFGGGLAWILGLLTPLASFGILCTMVVAVWFHGVKRGDPFVAQSLAPSYELGALYACFALLVLAAGPGRWALDRVIFGRRESL